MYQSDKDGVPFPALIPQFKTETALKVIVHGQFTTTIFSATQRYNIVIFANCLL